MNRSSLEFVASNYVALKDGRYTVNQNFEIVFPEKLFENEFNRIKLSYESEAPLRLTVYYDLDGARTEDYFFLDAHKTEFFGLISGYLDGKKGARLKKAVFSTCKKEETALSLFDFSVEILPLFDDDLFVENDRFKIGARLSWGGAMTYYEDKAGGIPDLANVINIHDTGRLIQQSFYGTYSNGEYVSGTQSGGTVWPYNPVQGGDKKNNGSRRLINVAKGEDYIYILSQALDWGFDNNISFCYYENKYTIKDGFVLVDNVATDYSGWKHISGGQEIPAVYLVSYFDTLCYYNGDRPWENDAEGLHYVADLGGWSASGSYYFGKKNTETWATWINTEDRFAFGIYCPNVDKLIAIRHQYNGSKDPMAGPTTYVAPSSSIVMQAYKPIKYSYLLTSGTPERVREVFFENKDFSANPSLSEDKFDQRVSLVRLDMSDMDFTSPKTHEILCGKRSTVVSFSDQMNATEFLITVPHDPYVTMDFESNCTRELVAEDYDTIEFEYMIPEENQLIWYVAVLFLCSGETKKPTGKITVKAPLIKDGQYHKASVSLPREIWNGKVHKLRFDFFHDAAEGDRMYLKRFRLLKKSE